tara:strand:+ start:5686 stop:6783 length:1098 start_codon:yes stop_codon:yes gene_type:complete
MSTGKTNLTSTQFAAKKLLGKAQTSNLKSDVNEIIPSNVSMPSEGIFAESVPNDPGTAFYTLYSASAGGPATVEQVYFDIVSISDTIYDANDTGGGGDEASGNGPHGYYLKLPAAYQTTSSNPQRGTGSFTNGKRVYDSRGGLQLIPPLISNASPNRYVMKIYKGDPTDAANEITSGDSIDWQVDYYAGTIFIQDYDASKIPLTASAYLYVGKYLDEKISDISASAGSTIVKDEGSNITTAVSSFDFVGAGVTATNSSNNVTITIPGGGGFARRAISSHATASINDRIIGVSGAAAIDIRLPSAGDYTAGQHFTVKDESGAANSKNITIRTSGSQTIDGSTSIILESPFAAVNIYSDGTSKFFIY